MTYAVDSKLAAGEAPPQNEEIAHHSMTIHSLLRVKPALKRGFVWFRTHLVAIWITALPFLVLYGVMSHRTEIGNVLQTLEGAERNWLLAGVGIQALILLSPALTYQVILRRLGHALPFGCLANMHMQRIVIGTFAPVSGPVSAFAFIRALNRRNVTTHDAVALLALRSLATQGAFITLLLTAIALRGPIYALCVGGVVILALAGVVPLLRRATVPTWMRPWRWRRLPRSASFKLVEFVQRVRRHRIRSSDLARPLAITISSRFGGMLLLVVSVKAMGVDVAPKAIATVLIAEIIAKIAMPFFHGIGVVEAATAIALQQSGMAADAAIGAALLWRAFEFWMPATVALASQAVVYAVAKLPGSVAQPVHLPQPRVGVMTEAPVLSNRRLVARIAVVVVAFLLGRVASGTSEMG